MKLLTEDNFLLYAAAHYDNPQCFSTEEFLQDVNRFKYLKRLISRYQKTGLLKTNLLLNHIIIITNLFGPEATVRMIFLKCSDQLDCIKPFLVALNILPDILYNIGEINTIYTSEISMDAHIVESLRKNLKE
jgi:hypothetical protein